MPRTITVGSIAPATGNTLSMQSGHTLRAPNTYINHWYVRSDNRTTYSASNSGDGNPLTDVRLVITPKYSNSTIRLRWMLHGEGNETAQTYDVAVRSSNGSNYTYFFNRTSGSTGTGNHEIGISYGFAWEISADY